MNNKNVLSSILFKAIERFSVKIIGLVIGIVLARILEPGVFGQLAVIMVFINLSQVFIQTGFSTSLVQRKDVMEKDYSTAFYISGLISLVLVGVLWFTAPLISRFYEYDEILLPLRIYAFILPIGAFHSIQLAKAQKEMRFKQMVVVSLLASVLSGALGIYISYAGGGLWALIAYFGSNTIFAVIGMFFVVHWMPRPQFSKERAKLLFGYGWKILVAALLCSLYSDVRTLLIGKRFTDKDLGYYNKARQFPEVVSNALDVSIQSVMLPTLSNVQDNRVAMKGMLRRSLTMGCFVIMPVMFGFSAIAENFILVLLTDKWAESIPYMRILCIADATIPILTSNLIAIKALGRSDTYMHLEILRRIIMLAILVVTVILFPTVKAIALSWVVSSYIDCLLAMLPMKRFLDYSIPEQLKDIGKSFFAAVLMGAFAYFVGWILPWSRIVVTVVQIVSSAIAYIVLSLLMKNESLFYLMDKIRRLLPHQG